MYFVGMIGILKYSGLLKTGLLAFFFIALSFACNQASGIKNTVPTPGVSDQNSTNSGKDPRDLLIESIRKLGTEVSSGDKTRILSIFQFPQPDSVFSIYLEDASFSKEETGAEDQLTSEIASRHYKDLYRSLQIDQFARLFTELKIDSLHQKQQLHGERKIKGKPCLHFYEINIDSNRVSFVYGTNSNPDYIPSPKEAESLIGDECESAIIWEFRWEGRRLIFISQTAAG